jgi:threonine dehydrogenase-like Zn-dependent dehydrogenase
MLAAVVTGPRRTELRRCRLPEAASGELLVHVEGCGVCASSLPVWQGRPWFTYPLQPGMPGHEIWGTLDDGRRVAALGLDGFAEVVAVPERSVIELPPELDGLPVPGEAIGCAVNVVRRARVRPGDRVAIVGVGFLGSAVASLLPDAAAFRRGDPLVDEAYDVVIEAAGTQGALDSASRLVAPGGRLVLAGFHQDGPRSVDVQSWNWRGLEVVNAHERDPAMVARGVREAVRLAAAGVIDLERLVTHRLPLDRLAEAFALAEARPPGFVKAVVCP